jgi:hypothetical protein
MYIGLLVSQVRQVQHDPIHHDVMTTEEKARPRRLTVYWRAIRGLFA